MRAIVETAVALGLLAAVTGGAHAAPNLLTNGSFELYSGSTFTGWTNGGSQGTTPMQFATPHPTDGVTAGPFADVVPSAPPGNSPDSVSGGGSQGAYFVADQANPLQTLSQTVTLMMGQTYEAGVSLFATLSGAANSNPFTLTVTIDGVTVASASAADPTPGIWKAYSASFMATGTSATFSFGFTSGDTPAKDIIADLAYVTASESTNADVPEPATVALLGMGLLGLGMIRRRS